MDNNIYFKYKDMVKQISFEYSKKFRMVERLDIEQELWLWFATHPNKTNEWNNLDKQKESDKLFAKSLRNAALDYCLKEKAHFNGGDVSDNFFYNKQFIKTMLPAVLSNDWTKLNNILTGFSRTTKALSESNDWIAYSADIMSAYGKLSERDQRLVYYVYGEQIPSSELKDIMKSDKTDKALMVEANRAVGKMIKSLGGYPPFVDNDYSYGEKSDDMSELP
jgi:hypothetical protein